MNYFGPNGAHRPKLKGDVPLSVDETRTACPYFQRHFGVKGISAKEHIFSKGDALEIPYVTQYSNDQYIYDPAIDIENTYAAVIRYQSGAMLSYSCNFSTPWEGFTLAINGTEGRLDVSHHSNPEPNGRDVLPPKEDVITYFPLFGGRMDYAISVEKGGHGGADRRLQADLFESSIEGSKDHEDIQADGIAGALAVACGEAIWRSATEGRPYQIQELMGRFYR